MSTDNFMASPPQGRQQPCTETSCKERQPRRAQLQQQGCFLLFVARWLPCKAVVVCFRCFPVRPFHVLHDLPQQPLHTPHQRRKRNLLSRYPRRLLARELALPFPEQLP